MRMYQVDLLGPWKLYTNTLPAGSTAVGIITRTVGNTGALVKSRAGLYAQVNSGVIRTLDQRAVYEAIRAWNKDHTC